MAHSSFDDNIMLYAAMRVCCHYAEVHAEVTDGCNTCKTHVTNHGTNRFLQQLGQLDCVLNIVQLMFKKVQATEHCLYVCSGKEKV